MGGAIVVGLVLGVSAGCNALADIQPAVVAPADAGAVDAASAATPDANAPDVDAADVDAASADGSPPIVSRWDVSIDFSSAKNPNGPWAYGYFDSELATAMTCGVPRGARRLAGWSRPESDNPSVLHNPTSTNQTLGEAPSIPVVFTPGRTAMHPGNSFDAALVRWTAPRRGRYSVDAKLFAIDDQGSEAVAVHRNGAVVASRDLLEGVPQARSLTYTFAGCLNACETFDFVVSLSGATQKFRYTSNTTAVEVAISIDDASPDKDGCPDPTSEAGACPVACAPPPP